MVNDSGEGQGFCLPLNFRKLFEVRDYGLEETIIVNFTQITPWTAKSEDISWKRKTEVTVAITDSDPENARILKLATDLGNTVLAKRAANDLQAFVLPSIISCSSANMDYRIKAKRAPGFGKPSIFRKVMQILEAHHFRLPACRFVLDLFEKRVLEQIVLEEEDEESEDSSGTDPDSDAEVGADVTVQI